MYNRYIRSDSGRYERIPVQESPPPPGGDGGYRPEPPPPPPPPGPERGPDPAAGPEAPPGSGQWGRPGGGPPPPPHGGGKKGILSGILEKLNLKDIDTGDLLLLVLIFLLFREGEDDELLIALGLLLIL